MAGLYRSGWATVLNSIAAGQRLAPGFVTSTVWPSAIGDANCSTRLLAMRRSRLTSGAYSGRRLKPTDCTGTVWPLTVTASCELEGAVNVPELSTKFQLSTAPPAEAVLTRTSSTVVGESTWSVLLPTVGIWSLV